MSARFKRREKEDARTWRERVRALRYVAPFLKLVWQTHRGYTSAIILLRLVRAFLPVVILWTGKLIIDAVVAARVTPSELSRLWKLVALEVAFVLVNEALTRASSLVESLLGDLFSNHTSVRLMKHAATLDLYQFEDPAFYDQLERARRQTTGRIGLLAQFLSMGQDALTLLSLGAALLVYSPLLLLLLAVSVLPSFLGETHFASLQYSLLYRWTPERRQLDYLRYVGASDRSPSGSTLRTKSSRFAKAWSPRASPSSARSATTGHTFTYCCGPWRARFRSARSPSWPHLSRAAAT
jgi:ATP-binding cassette subfamily B protein